MKRHTVAAALVLALSPAALPPAGAQAPLDPATADLLLHEVRLLRQAIERQGAFQAHVQLLSGRLAIQDQRVARLHARAERLQTDAEEARRERERVLATREAIQRGRDSATGYEQQEQMEAELQRVELLAAQAEARYRDLETRRAQAHLELEQAQARFEELESFFDQLDRELNRTAR